MHSFATRIAASRSRHLTELALNVGMWPLSMSNPGLLTPQQAMRQLVVRALLLQLLALALLILSLARCCQSCVISLQTATLQT